MIIPAGDRATEREVSAAVVAYLHTQPYGAASFDLLRFNVPLWIKLSDKDREVARERDNEPKWVGVLRNIAAHSKTSGNFIHDGVLVKRRGGGYQLASRVKPPPVTV